MSNFNQYFSTLTITYLLEAYALRKVSVIDENELILNITSMVSVMGTKEQIAIPSQNKHLYVEMLNKNSGIMMIVLDELVNANYIIRKKDNINTTYMVNFEHDYIKKFVASHGAALKYVSHPSYSFKRKLEANDENSLCTAIENMKISETLTTPINSKTKSINIGPEVKKKKMVDESESNESTDSDSDYEDNLNIVKKLDEAFCEEEDEKEEDNEEEEDEKEEDNEEEEVYYVKSESNPKVKYAVTSTSCSCPAFTYGKGKPCKHMDSLPTNAKNAKKSVSNSIEVKKHKFEQLMNIKNIKNIYSLQSESDLDKFYNICQHTNNLFTCTCPSFKYQFAKMVPPKNCKHIHGFLANYYQKYDKFTLLFNFPGKKDTDNTPVLLQNDNLNTFKNHFDQKLHNNEFISNYVNDTTLYHGLYVWVFDDSLTDSKLEKEAIMKENQKYMEEKEKNNA